MYGYNFQNYQPNYQQTQNTDERIWVQNQASAEAYLMIPNSFVRLWDASQPIFYEKRTDAVGRPQPIDIYKYEKIAPNRPISDNGATIDYQSQINDIIRRISALEGKNNEQCDTDVATV